MKQFALGFFRRGIVACGFGPIVLAIVYVVLQRTAAVETLSVHQVCVGIYSVTALAFLTGGMNAIYGIERLPLMWAILLHGGVLYAGYLATYLINDWLDWGMTPILVFTGIFVVGYLLIWAVIYSVIRRNTARINAVLKEQQERAG